MAPIGIVAMLSQTSGEFWIAGAVAATYALSNALLAPQISRAVDRLGQFLVLLPMTLVSTASFMLLIASANLDWPIWTLFGAAIAAATMPSFQAMIRARWSKLFRDRPELNTAFAFEGAADELIYILGASLSVGLSVSLFPEAGLVASTLFLLSGGLAFLTQRRTEPLPSAGRSTGSAIRQRPVQVMMLALIFVGAIFATAEVSAVAITKELGEPRAASVVVGLYAMGSFFAGLIMGALNLRFPLERQLAAALGVLALTALPLPFVHTVPALTIAVFVSGIAISPTFITAFALVERRVPPAMLTEGITWVMTGLGIGVALGAFASGWVVDTLGASNGFCISIVAGALAFLTVLLGQGTLSAREDPQLASNATSAAE